MNSQRITILGAGIAGLSASYHFGHSRCDIFEKQPRAGGHTRSESTFGYTFDQGPHVSFTKHEYVRDLFTCATGGAVHEFDVRTRNYFQGHWIDHPAQVHLWQVPQPLRDECFGGLMNAATAAELTRSLPLNYEQWLHTAFGPQFAETFPAAYTRKYWTVEPARLSTDWVDGRIHRPTPEQLHKAMHSGTSQACHYITRVRYPQQGGFERFLNELTRGAHIRLGSDIAAVDLATQRVHFSDGATHDYEHLVTTLPLPTFVNCCLNAPDEVRAAAAELDCTQLLLVNVCAPHPAQIDGHWFYIYDENKYSTRIHIAERLSPHNAPPGHTAVQVEVYFSRYRPCAQNADEIAEEVARELVEMGFVDEAAHLRGDVQVFWRWAPHANVIFTHPRREALDRIFRWLEQYGLAREYDDLEPISDWSKPLTTKIGRIMLAGRFAQWKYYWTDDCVLRGRHLGGGGR